MIEEQRVRAVAREWGLGKAKTGTEQVAVSFELLDGPDEGQRITWYGYFTEKTWDRTVKALQFCGWQGDDLSQLEGLDQEVELVIQHEANLEGEYFPKVQWVNGLGGGGVVLKEKLEGRELQSFAAQMKGRIKALNAGQKPAAKPASRPAPARQAPPARRQPEPPASDYDDRGENGPPPPSDEDAPPWVRS